MKWNSIFLWCLLAKKRGLRARRTDPAGGQATEKQAIAEEMR